MYVPKEVQIGHKSVLNFNLSEAAATKIIYSVNFVVGGKLVTVLYMLHASELLNGISQYLLCILKRNQCNECQYTTSSHPHTQHWVCVKYILWFSLFFRLYTSINVKFFKFSMNIDTNIHVHTDTHTHPFDETHH